MWCDVLAPLLWPAHVELACYFVLCMLRVLSRSGRLEENAPFWYSYDHGSAHFVVVSSEHSLKHGSDQWQWLQAHLPTVDRCKTPWLILAIHRPLYVIHPHHANRKVRPS